MGRIFTVELEGRSYRCRFCRTHLALPDDLISKSFHCRRGKAYLFNRSNQRMRKLRSTKKANLFWKGEGSWMKWIYQQRFTSILEATQKILEMLALDSYLSCVRVWGIMFVKIRAC
ncbi:protein yippee-like At3g11230 isoform X2 [Brassica napus]|uniref:protein yippee-like At3g11230 isoform X2 n=1 Tax=Brassica napus TaxID=3708 RepID=UPI0020785724|nr:protein yippee-like At3g11230 isoform X2 [Brassica napus]